MTNLAACGGSNGGTPPAASGGAGTPTTYTVAVNVSGLSGSGLVLQLNMGSDLAITADGNATFATAVASGTSYNVIVKTQPSSPAQTCTVAGGSGSVSPTTTFTLPSTLGLTAGFITGVATDSLGYVYVSASTEMDVFAPTASGVAMPARTIVPPGPPGCSGTSSILKFPGGANGTGTGSPVADIIAGVPAGNEITSLRFDAAGNLYVFGRIVAGDLRTPNLGVTRFAPTAVGFATPTSEILITPPHTTETFFVGFGVH